MRSGQSENFHLFQIGKCAKEKRLIKGGVEDKADIRPSPFFLFMNLIKSDNS